MKKTEWFPYLFELENDQYENIIIDTNLEGIAPIADKTQQVKVIIKTQTVSMLGICEPSEIFTLGNLTEALVDIIPTKHDAAPIGWISKHGEVHVYFYFSNTEGYEESLKEVMEKFPEYKYSSSVKSDPEWKDYFELFIKRIKNKID